MSSPRIQCVLGDRTPDELGRTLTHEHLSMDFTHFYTEPPNLLAPQFEDSSITLPRVGYLKQYPYSLKYNLVFNDEDTKKAVLDDVAMFKKSGGGTIVENSTIGLVRDIDFSVQVSKETGINIVVGSGYYIGDVQDAETSQITKETMYETMLRELTEGICDFPSFCDDCECKKVKAGFLGEIASVWPITDFEKRAIQAAGEVQEHTGCGVSFHPHRNPDAPFEILRLYLEAGGRADKAVMSHLDRTFLTTDVLLAYAALGSYCQFDLFGVETSYYQLNKETDMPSDAQRLDKLKTLVEHKFEDKLLMSHDVHTKHRLANFGGHGYSHILNNVLPKMEIKGFTKETIDKITITNPARWLTINK